MALSARRRRARSCAGPITVGLVPGRLAIRMVLPKEADNWHHVRDERTERDSRVKETLRPEMTGVGRLEVAGHQLDPGWLAAWGSKSDLAELGTSQRL